MTRHLEPLAHVNIQHASLPLQAPYDERYANAVNTFEFCKAGKSFFTVSCLVLSTSL